ncbi:LptF/LptG family permease [Terrimonas pollutisoli]|uniref:LptF/LptG family permease n=1 Tax=Terrimonas pollutisoli TaxID=3034147 RepID=UPI0023ED0E0B|nr:LptF/LptG family permease [Terrimonas sp. H1YJ31]
MGRIDWYILKNFLVTFVFCMLLFMVVAVAVDTSEKADDFVKTGLSTYQIIVQYYFGFVPFIWGLLFPLFVFISVIFFTSRMASRSEIIAILASGTSYNRMLRPYIVGGVFLGLVLWLGNRYLIPKANEIQGKFKTQYFDKNDPTKNQQFSNCRNCFYRRIDAITYIGIKNFDTVSKSGSPFFLDRVRNNRVVYNLRAVSIQWDVAKKKWILQNVIERRVDSMRETTKQYPTLELNISLKPEELRKDEYLKDRLTTPQLAAFIRQEKARGTEGLSALEVEQYRRTATPFAVLLLTIIGVVLASRKTRGGSGKHLAIGIITAALFIMSDRFSTVFATKSNFPPLLAAWVPNIIFSIVALWMYKKAPK